MKTLGKFWILLLLVLVGLAGVSAWASDQEGDEGKAGAGAQWGQWRGPNATGAAPEGANPPLEWSEGKNVKWKVPIPGEGSSSAIVWGDKVFVQTAVKVEGDEGAAAGDDAIEMPQAFAQQGPAREGPGERRRKKGGGGGFRGGGAAAPVAHRFMLMCFDRETGDLLWEQVTAETTPHEGHHANHAYGSHTPITDGEHVYAYFGSRGLYCYDMDGNLKWERDFGKMTTRATFGEGTSLALHGDKLVVNFDHEGPSFIEVIDKTSGETVWKKDRDELTTWATPLVVEVDGKAQVITNGKTAVRSYDLDTGEILWTSTGQTERPVATPVSDGENVFVMSGHRGSKLSAIKLAEAEGDVTGTDVEFWTLSRDTPDIASPLLSDGRLYFVSGKGTYFSGYHAATGEKLFGPERIEGLRDIYSSPAAAGGRLYLVVRDGTTLVLKDGDELEVLAVNTLDDEIDGSPAIVDGEMFLRGKNYLYCIAEG
ncbi:MAG: PQQ-binding-like beta-propeller repeat protein [Verrucomicrobiota bacterium]